MSLSLPKLQHLWKHQPKIPDYIEKRYRRIIEIADRWDQDSSEIQKLKAVESASELGFPDDQSWGAVKARQRAYFDEVDALKPHIALIEEVSDLLRLQKPREAIFRVSSNAPADKAHEKINTNPNASNPESHLASYNHPFEVVQFYVECAGNTQPHPRDEKLPLTRFPYKYIWMLANRENCLPIFSLASFQGIHHVLQELDPEKAWNEVCSDWWELSLNRFIEVWPDTSDKLCQAVTGQNYSILSPEQKRKLQTLIFMSSIESTTTKNAFDMLQTGNKALILYGPPGTGKTFQAKKVAKQMLGLPEADKKGFEAQQFGKLTIQGAPPNNFQDGCWELVQFHPSFSYQDFMGGILPRLEANSLSYKLIEGLFMRFCKAAAAQPEKPFVLIIDEINRADLSSVFGELMYALEYRGEQVQVTHFGGFFIPKNVYLIGTMNTADKSLVSFDLALRRRFTFLKLAPDLECLMDWGADKDVKFNPEDTQELIKRAKALNDFLIQSPEGPGLPADFAIGQAYFMKVRDFCSLEEEGGGRSITSFALEQLWDYHLEPLIEECLGAGGANLQPNIKAQRESFTATLTSEA